MIYMDHAATTAVEESVLAAMLPFFREQYGNASSPYGLGQSAKMAVEDSRRRIAALLGVPARGIYFTAGGTEADNWAIRGAAEQAGSGHIITSQIEHHAVLHTCEYLERHGFSVTYLPVDGEGFVEPAMVEAAIRPDTFLVSIMAANNEIGTIQRLSEIGEITHRHGILFHTDGVQALGQVPLDIEGWHIDLLSASAHKVYGPKGTGLLYRRPTAKLRALLEGGAQEKGLRAGTENVAGIVGMAQALENRFAKLSEEGERLRELRDYMIERICLEIPGSILSGSREARLPGNVHFCFPDVDNQSLLLLLDQKNICVSAGSACASGSLTASHVLEAIGRKPQESKGSLRFTLGRENTKEEADAVVDCLVECVDKLRKGRKG